MNWAMGVRLASKQGQSSSWTSSDLYTHPIIASHDPPRPKNHDAFASTARPFPLVWGELSRALSVLGYRNWREPRHYGTRRLAGSILDSGNLHCEQSQSIKSPLFSLETEEKDRDHTAALAKIAVLTAEMIDQTVFIVNSCGVRCGVPVVFFLLRKTW